MGRGRVQAAADIIGWDVGGAHLKAARVAGARVTAAAQIACPLWLGPGQLDAAFAAAREAVGSAPLNVLTMTGEQSDAFASREDGVEAVAAIAARLLAPGRLLLYAARAGLVEADRARALADDIASVNWHASAALAGTRCSEALLIDLGSTTTDVIPIVAGRPACRGFTDAGRLAEGELVYTGLGRTFLMAGPKLVPFGGRRMGLMNEWFAEMADVHRILGRLPPAADLMETTDGRDKGVAASCDRLARMIGMDGVSAREADWRRLARVFAEDQLRVIMDAAFLTLSRGDLPESAPIVGAGVGRALVEELARRLERPYLAFDLLIDAAPEARETAADCAPAAAVALLAARQSRA